MGRARKRRVPGWADPQILAELLKQGVALAEIGRRFGVSHGTVRYWAVKFAIVLRRRRRANPLQKVPREEIVALKAQGVTDDELAARYGASMHMVRHYRAKHQISAPPSSICRGDVVLTEARTRDLVRVADRGREAALFGGQRFTDDPRAPSREPRWQPPSPDWGPGRREL